MMQLLKSMIWRLGSQVTGNTESWFPAQTALISNQED